MFGVPDKKMKFLELLIFLLCAIALSSKAQDSKVSKLHSTRVLGGNDAVTCLLFEASDDEQFIQEKPKKKYGRKGVYDIPHEHEDEDKPVWRCAVERLPGTRFVLELGSKFDHILEESVTGRTRIKIKGAKIQDTTIVVPNDAQVQVLAMKPEDKNKSFGFRDVLVLIVRANDRSVTSSVREISRRIFGVSDDQCDDVENIVNLRSQFLACSYGKLRFDPIRGVPGGVAEVVLDTNVAGRQSDEIEIIATNQAIVDGLPVADADHVMICLPPGTVNRNGSPDWTPYAEVDGQYSVYNNAWCQYVSGHMHEIGHNLNLQHSGDITETSAGVPPEYGDQTSYMGISYEEINAPKMCFNAAKSWQLGWYRDCHEVFDLRKDNTWKGKLIGVSDYNNGKTCSSYFNVLLKIVEPGTEEDVYMTYNRKNGINAGTRESADLVTVVRGAKGDTSDLLFSLDEGQTCALRNFGNLWQDLFIGVSRIEKNSEPNFAQVCLSTGETGRVLPPEMELCLEELLSTECEQFKKGNDNEVYQECKKEQYNLCRSFLFDFREDEDENENEDEDEDEDEPVVKKGKKLVKGSKGGARNLSQIRERKLRSCRRNSDCKDGVEECRGRRCVSTTATKQACIGVDAVCGVFSNSRGVAQCANDGTAQNGKERESSFQSTFPGFSGFTCPTESAYCFYYGWAVQQKFSLSKRGGGYRDQCGASPGSLEAKAIWKFCEAFVGDFDGLVSSSCACDCATYVQRCCAPQNNFYCKLPHKIY